MGVVAGSEGAAAAVRSGVVGQSGVGVDCMGVGGMTLTAGARLMVELDINLNED